MTVFRNKLPLRFVQIGDLCASRIHFRPRVSIAAMPWWAALGGLIGAFAVVAGLLFVGEVGAGTFGGLTITANILMSLLIDKYGWFGMTVHELTAGRVAGPLLKVAGIFLISRF